MTNTIAIKLPNAVAKITYCGKNNYSIDEISNIPIVNVLELKNRIYLLIITTCNVKLTTNAQLFCFLIPFCIFYQICFESFETSVTKCWVWFNQFRYLFFFSLSGRTLVTTFFSLLGSCAVYPAVGPEPREQMFPALTLPYYDAGLSFSFLRNYYCFSKWQQRLYTADGRAYVIVDVIANETVVTRSLTDRE